MHLETLSSSSIKDHFRILPKHLYEHALHISTQYLHTVSLTSILIIYFFTCPYFLAFLHSCLLSQLSALVYFYFVLFFNINFASIYHFLSKLFIIFCPYSFYLFIFLRPLSFFFTFHFSFHPSSSIVLYSFLPS
jgi:hypothetical protein